MPKTYLSTMAAQSSNNPHPTTYAATRYRRHADMILGGTTGRAVGECLMPVGDAGTSVMSPAGSTGTSAVLLGQGCQRLVVCGQFRVVIIIFADHRDGDGDRLARALQPTVPTGRLRRSSCGLCLVRRPALAIGRRSVRAG